MTTTQDLIEQGIARGEDDTTIAVKVGVTVRRVKDCRQFMDLVNDDTEGAKGAKGLERLRRALNRRDLGQDR